MRTLTLVVVLLGLFSSCTKPDRSTMQNPLADIPTSMSASDQHPIMLREPEAGLSENYARFRSTQLSNVRYTLSIDLATDVDTFSGTVTVGFDLAPDNTSPVTLDFDSGNIVELAINNKPAPFTYSRWFLTLAPEILQPGRNVVVIRYSRPYATDGAGLHHFRDPEDNREYLYTNFEPYAANRWFPHFDQPDIKAPLTLDVLAPSQWQIIANSRETFITQTGDRKHWQFPATAPLSSYVYAMHAGPFAQWESAAGEIPLRLFARQSMAAYVIPEDWFEPTRNSFRFYQDYFDVPYPFGKYDQIIVPDFNAGAMENVAAVTFREGYLSRGTPSLAQRRTLANVISHEMAHMWFGDLVTMQWWNGLWLNESFATYMAHLALESASNFQNVWDTFYTGNKMSAYTADARVTTHPIELKVNSTTDAFSNFDGITYGKGASVLRQLPFFIGEENFRVGVSNYLKSHAFGNSTLNDFVSALAQASGINLDLWQQQWLYMSGTNTITPEITCTAGSISQLTLLQAPPSLAAADQILRSQRTQVGLYRYTDQRMVLGTTLPVLYSGARTEVPEASGLPCPDLVLPNESDWAFMKINLDEHSRATLNEHINDFENPTTRLMLWQSQWDSVLDGIQSLATFTDFALNNLSGETDNNVLRHVTGLLNSAFMYFVRFDTSTDMPARLERFAFAELQAATPASENQKIWYAAFVRSAHTPEGLGYLHSQLDGTIDLQGLVVDQDKRWDIVEAMNRYAFADYAQLLEQEQIRDPSDQGNNMALASTVVRPDAQIKAHWLDVIIDSPDTYKLATLRYLMANLFPPEQQSLLEPLKERILGAVPGLNANAPIEFLSDYATYMSTSTCTQASVDRLEEANRTFTGMQASVVKTYLIHHQNDARCVMLKKTLEQTAP